MQPLFLAYNTFMAKTQAANARMRAESRAKILAAAQQVFIERGAFAARIGDIAAAAQMSPGNLYWHFRTKEEILAEIVREGLAGQREMLAAVAEMRAPAREKLDALLDGALALLESQRGMERLLLSINASGPDMLARLGIDLDTETAVQDACLERIFVDARREGALAGATLPTALAGLFRALLRGMALSPDLPPGEARAALERLLNRPQREDNRYKWKRPA